MEKYILFLGLILIMISIFNFFLYHKHKIEEFYVKDKNQTYISSFIPLDNEKIHWLRYNCKLPCK